jgi:hypothetical protein
MIKLKDNRVEIPLDFSDAELLVLFKQAHECDMTFNAFVEKALVDYLEQIQNDNLLNKLDGTSVDAMVSRPWPYPEAD